MFQILLVTVFYLLTINCISAGPKSIPLDNLYDKSSIIPVEFQKKDYGTFYYWYLKKYKKKPKIVYKLKAKMVSHIPKRDLKKFQQELGRTRYKTQNHAPFRYYDKSYKSRFLKGYEELEDVFSGYKDYKLNEMYLKGVAEEFPELVSYFTLGKTHGGRDIPAIRISVNNLDESKASILFNCAHHANELVGTEHCYDIIYTLLNESEKFTKVLENVNVWVVPIVNPDGSYLFWYKSTIMGRKNGFLFPEQNPDYYGRGVDLNRNYPFKWNSGHPTASSAKREHPFYRGVSPGSEPETQAMMGLVENERFVMSMSFHTFATRVLFPYTIEDTTNPQPDFAKELTERIVKYAVSYSPTRKYEAVKNIYPVDGTDQDYFYFKYGTLALLTESSHKNIPYENVHFILDGFRPSWKKFLSEYINGYKLILNIIDEEDNPVTAKVSIEEYVYSEGEEFTNNPLSGYFHRLFPDDSEYTLKIIAPEYKTEVLKFRPYKDFKVTTVVLKK
ncbi:MAG: peptidase M14 [Leptospiraceae bacterium]|nr:peptidase M14 [Leptospiraceae bacterium]